MNKNKISMYTKILILIFIMINICFSKEIKEIDNCNSGDNWIEYLSKSCKKYKDINNKEDILNICKGLECYLEYRPNKNKISFHLNQGCINISNSNNFKHFKYQFNKGCRISKNQYIL